MTYPDFLSDEHFTGKVSEAPELASEKSKSSLDAIEG